jgi:ABC-2 type transport system ATP-binding protein
MSDAPRLEVTGLRHAFGKQPAVDGVSLRLDRPLIVGIVGPNGSGKTTMIRAMMGLLRPQEGQILIEGRTPHDAVAKGLVPVGYMPQNEALYTDLTVEQNLRFFARLHGVSRGRRTQAVDEAIALVRLGERVGDRVAQLSGGMRRRVSLAAALVHRPRLVVLDEPTVGVDPELRADMWREFARLRDGGSLLLMSTHYLGEAQRCDLVVFLRQGRILAGDTPAALMKRTRTADLEEAFLALSRSEATV